MELHLCFAKSSMPREIPAPSYMFFQAQFHIYLKMYMLSTLHLHL